MAAAVATAGVAAVVVGLVGSCTNPPAPAGQPGPATAEPTVQVGLVIGSPSIVLGGDAALTLSGPDGARLVEIPAGESWRVEAGGEGIALISATGARAGSYDQLRAAAADSSVPVRVGGRAYHGTLALLRDRTGLTVVNQVGLEAYLRGVVSSEMGRRDPSEQEALRAQAVVSRTYAVRNLGRWRSQGFDLYGTVADQVYAGIGGETPEGQQAVESTRGQILTYGGAPIDAFFFSTCGGRTADGVEVFRGAERPYLRSIADVSPDGTVYCSISPRYRWREEWTGDALRAALRKSLPAVLGVSAGRVQDVQDVRIASRSASGRVSQLTIVLAEDQVQVDGPSVRQVLRNGTGDILRSTAFSLAATKSGRRLTRLVVDGGGNGHGVGFCQWGAVGRARSGQDYEHILAAYYPETELQRQY